MQHAVLLRSFFSSYYDVIESLFVFVNCNYSFPSTAKSFVELTRFLLLQHGSEGLLLLGERISQDPLENYFGKQQARSG